MRDDNTIRLSTQQLKELADMMAKEPGIRRSGWELTLVRRQSRSFPASRSARRTHVRSVSRVQSIFDAIDEIADH